MDAFSRTSSVATALTFVESMLHKLRHSRDHAVYLRAVLGTTMRASFGLLFLLTALQLSASAMLVHPGFVPALGTVKPCLFLAISITIEHILYLHFADTEMTLHFLFLNAHLSLLALRRRRVVVKSGSGNLVSDSSVALGAHITALCTRARARVSFSCASALLLIAACRRHWYYGLKGAEADLHRASFLKTMSLCSILVLLASCDKSGVRLRDLADSAIEHLRSKRGETKGKRL